MLNLTFQNFLVFISLTFNLKMKISFNSSVISFKIISIQKQQAPSWQLLTPFNWANIWAFGTFKSMSNSEKSAIIGSSQFLLEIFSEPDFCFRSVSIMATIVENVLYFLSMYFLEPCYSKCGPESCSIGNTCELVRYQNCRPLSSHQVRIYIFTRSSGYLCACWCLMYASWEFEVLVT